MLLMIVLGLLTTLLGVAFGCTVLELTLRALAHSLPIDRQSASLDPGAGSRLQPDA